MLSGTRLEGAPAETTNRLYKNNRDGTFTDVTAKAGLTRTGWASAVTVGDYDNDGFEDLFITCYGQNVLYRNNGDGTFTDVTAKAGLRRRTRCDTGPGCTWVDYNRDGHLDLFVANYLDTTLEKLPKPGENADCHWKGVPVNCGPRGLPPGRSAVSQQWRRHVHGCQRQSGIAAARGGYPMTAVAADFDNDGWPDIYVACDSTPSWLFRNNHDGTFNEEAPRARRRA